MNGNKSHNTSWVVRGSLCQGDVNPGSSLALPLPSGPSLPLLPFRVSHSLKQVLQRIFFVEFVPQKIVFRKTMTWFLYIQYVCLFVYLFSYTYCISCVIYNIYILYITKHIYITNIYLHLFLSIFVTGNPKKNQSDGEIVVPHTSMFFWIKGRSNFGHGHSWCWISVSWTIRRSSTKGTVPATFVDPPAQRHHNAT